MIAILALLALPLGYLVRRRLVAFVLFGLAFAHVYTFQTANLVIEWVNGSDAAFARSTATEMFDGTLGYFAVTTVIYAVGLALLALGNHLRTRRDRRRAGAELDTLV